MFSSHLRGFIRDTSGNYALFGAMAAVPLLMGVSLAIDYSRITHARATTQEALDASLLGAIDSDGDLDEDAAQQIFSDNLGIMSGQTATTPVYTEDSDGNWNASVYAVTPLTFGNLILPETITTKIVSKAGISSPSSATTTTADIGCIYTLYNGGQSFLQNSNAVIDAPNCTIDVGTTVSSTQITGFNSGFHLDVKKICVAGTLSYDNRTSSEKASVTVETQCETPGDFIYDTAVDLASNSTLTTLKNGSAVFSDWKSFDYNSLQTADQYSWLTSYSDGDPSNTDAIESVVAANKRVVLLEPGRYKSMNFNSGNYAIILKPGLYVIDGSWNVNGQDMIGEEVSLFFTGDGKLQPNSGMGLEFSAPTSGDFKGMLWWEDPRVSSWNSWSVNDNKSYSYLKGVIYLPNREYTLNSSAQATYNATFMVKKLTINSDTDMTFGDLSSDYTPDNSHFNPPTTTTTAASSTATKIRLLL